MPAHNFCCYTQYFRPLAAGRLLGAARLGGPAEPNWADLDRARRLSPAARPAARRRGPASGGAARRPVAPEAEPRLTDRIWAEPGAGRIGGRAEPEAKPSRADPAAPEAKPSRRLSRAGHPGG